MGCKAIKAFVSSFARMGSGARALLSADYRCGSTTFDRSRGGEAHAFGKNTKNMENAKELTKKYGSSVEEIAII